MLRLRDLRGLAVVEDLEAPRWDKGLARAAAPARGVRTGEGHRDSPHQRLVAYRPDRMRLNGGGGRASVRSDAGGEHERVRKREPRTRDLDAERGPHERRAEHTKMRRAVDNKLGDQSANWMVRFDLDPRKSYA